MTFEMGVVLAILVLAVVLFSTEFLSIDLVALIIMAALMGTGVLTPAEGFAGFSDAATVTIGAMFVLSAGLTRTGAVNAVSDRLARAVKRHYLGGLALLMLSVGTISAFINNTACVALFLPIAVSMAAAARVSPSKLLMPVSFAAILGGTCTLIGTSPNLVVSSVAASHGLPAFGMFEFTRLGLISLAVGSAYMVLVGTRLIPDRRATSEVTGAFGMADYLTEIVLLPGGSSVDRPLAESPLVQGLDIDVLQIHREGDVLSPPLAHVHLRENDVLRVRCDVQKLRQLQGKKGIRLKSDRPLSEEALDPREAVLVEVVISPNSPLIGRSLKDFDFRSRFGSTAIALRHHDELLHENLGNVPLSAGDGLLVEVRREQVEFLKAQPGFVFVTETGESWFRRRRIPLALGIFASVVLAASAAGVPMVLAALLGALLMVLSGCLSIEEAYRSLDLKVLFMIAGALSLGAALEKTGADAALARFFAAEMGSRNPVLVVGGVYLLAMVLTELISNAATAALVAPLALNLAVSLEVDPRPLLIAVTFASSASFMTPVGYQTNTMIFGPGQYRFSDFLRVGIPLNLLCWLLASLLIPVFWPL